MTPKLTLDLSEVLNFKLLGIVSQDKDYKVCHFLNTYLNLDFKKVEDVNVTNAKSSESFLFSKFSFQDPNNDEVWTFIANKDSNYKPFFSELQQLDYILAIDCNWETEQLNDFIKKLKSLKPIIAVYQIERKTIKSKDMLHYFIN